MENQVPAKISLSTVFTREYHTSFHTGDAFLCFASYDFIADVLQNTYHMLLTRRYSRFVFVVVRDAFDLRAKSRLGDKRRSESSLRRGSHLLAMFFEIVEDVVETVCDPYHYRTPSYIPPSGSSTYGSVKTYTGHRPRIIFRSRTRMTDMRACRVFYSHVRGG